MVDVLGIFLLIITVIMVLALFMMAVDIEEVEPHEMRNLEKRIKK